MPFGKRFRLGGGSAPVVGSGDGESNLDALSGTKQKDFSHLVGGSGKIDLERSSDGPEQDPIQKEFDRENPGISGQLQSQPAEVGPSSNRESNPYRLETAEELESRDPEEVISVPMIFTVEKMGVKKLLGKRETERKITFRKMRRGQYRAHYAKDANGNYIGTEKPAFDAGLVYVHSTTAEDIDKQIKGVAFGKEHYASSFPSGGTGYTAAWN